MSIMISASSPRRSPAYRRLCGELFGDHIRTARLRDGRPVAELAAGAGLTVDEWEEIEGGRIPDTWEHVLLLAAVLHFERSSWLPYFARQFQGAQEN